jgi:hypothetical protein
MDRFQLGSATQVLLTMPGGRRDDALTTHRLEV